MAISPEILQKISEAITGVRFGHVQITIHDARVVQIEKSEKIRVESPAYLVSGGIQEQCLRDDRTSGSPRLDSGR